MKLKITAGILIALVLFTSVASAQTTQDPISGIMSFLDDLLQGRFLPGAIASTTIVDYAGWRTSDYGVETSTAVAQSNYNYWVNVAKGMQKQFPGAGMQGYYTVGYIGDGTSTVLPDVLEDAIGTMSSVEYDSGQARSRCNVNSSRCCWNENNISSRTWKC